MLVGFFFFFLSKIIYSIISGTFCVVERISIISKAVQLTVNVFSASLENIMSHVSCMWLWLCGLQGSPQGSGMHITSVPVDLTAALIGN